MLDPYLSHLLDVLDNLIGLLLDVELHVVAETFRYFCTIYNMR